MLLRIVLLVFGVFSCATAVIFIKYSEEHPILLSSYRLLAAAALLTPLMLRDMRRTHASAGKPDLRNSILPGIILGLHFITWIVGARMTSAVNASLIVNLVPVAMPFFLFVLIRERITRRELGGTLLAMVGLVILGGHDFTLSRDSFWGDVLCLVSMVFFAGYLALGRRHRRGAGLWSYVVPLYYAGGIFCLAVGILFVNPIKRYPPSEILWVFALAVVPTILGHTILNHSMRTLRGQLVSIVNMGQFLFAGIMAAFCFGEIPTWPFYLASVLLVAGCALAILGQGAVTRHQ